MVPRSIKIAVYRTLAFYELFAVGRTAKQLVPYLLEKSANLAKTEQALDQLAEAKVIRKLGNQYGFTDKSVERVSKGRVWAAKKRVVADRIARAMQRMPFIRMVAVTQSVAMETAKESSDVDVFTITVPNRLWTARFLAMARLKLTGLAKRHGATADHGCFGFWVDTTALNLQPIAFDDDIYLAFWLAHAVPLVDRKDTYVAFVNANQSLLKRFPNWRPLSVMLEPDNQPVSGPTSLPAGSQEESRKTRHGSLIRSSPDGHRGLPVEDDNQRVGVARFVEWLLGGRIGDWLESLLYQVQSKKIWRDDIAHRNGASVVANLHVCKLHHFDKRAELRDRWRETIKKSTPV